MTPSSPELQRRSRILQAAQLVVAALAAIAIAVATQGWPDSGRHCDVGSICDGV